MIDFAVPARARLLPELFSARIPAEAVLRPGNQPHLWRLAERQHQREGVAGVTPPLIG